MTRLENLLRKGIRRSGDPKRGFRYAWPDGRRVSAEERERIEALRIPPAWTEVAIATSARDRLQAVGRDRRGRWQYRYHERQTAAREARKLERLVRFVEALPRMRARVARDLAKRGLGRDTVLAAMLKILSMSFVRPGSEVYADENGSFGLATLRPDHVRVRGEVVTLEFPGKAQKQQFREIRDAQIARLVRRLLRVPTRDVFKFQIEDGTFVDVRRRHINDYIKEVMGEKFSAKDFRTWAGTLICACMLARSAAEPVEVPKARKRMISAAIQSTAAALGNTPAVCRASYVSPRVLAEFTRGRVIHTFFSSLEHAVSHRMRGLHPAERAVLRMLRSRGR